MNVKSGKWCPGCAGNQKGTIEKMRKMAIDRGGQCLSEEYINNYTKLAWQCEEGHQWNAVPNSIKRGKWCPVCAGSQKGTIEEMRKMAMGRGGQCLSEEYTNNYTKLAWQCEEGHQWNAVPSSIKRGFWCPVCAANAQKCTIGEMQRIAEERGGKCLSKEYLNNYSKLTWQCRVGHLWEASPSNVKSGSWCTLCARKK